jgi:hypothetical protein
MRSAAAASSRKRLITGLSCAGLIAGAPAVEAGECVVNANPVPPQTLAQQLKGVGSLPGQLAGVPYSVVDYGGVNVLWTGCAAECVLNDYPGDTQCGNLVETPIDSLVVTEIAAVPDPLAFSEVSAEQSPNGKWNVAANAFISPEFEEPNGAATYSFELGTREVIDVGGGPGTKPLDIRLRVGSHLAIQQCVGGLFTWIPHHNLQFRVTELTTFTTLIPSVYYDQFFLIDDTFTIDVYPGLVLVLDVYFDAGASATGANDIFGNQCTGGIATLDFAEGPERDGIQLYLSPDPSITLTPRSGMIYEVPEADAGPAAIAVLLALATRRARRS